MAGCQVKGMVKIVTVGDETIEEPVLMDESCCMAMCSSVYDKTTDPTANDDADAGYYVGTKWFNVTDNKVFTCVDNTNDNAVWVMVACALAFFYEEDEDEDTEAADNDWHQKVRLTITPAVSSDYLIEWSCEITNDDTAETTDVQLDQDEGTVLGFSSYEPEIADAYQVQAGIKKVTLTAAAHTFDMDFKRTVAGTAKIRRARITARRIS